MDDMPVHVPDDQAVIDDTLAWCNEQRRKKGFPPLDALPKGRRDDPKSCPCGKATGMYVERLVFAESEKEFRDGTFEHLPPAVQKFISAFDEGFLPEYDSAEVERSW